MLRMILADDEALVREILREAIPWEEFGITIIGEADNGRQTLEMCLEMKPDILLSDIKMPLMDGLEVAMNLKERGETLKIIFISGVQDFNYAKTALDIEADGFIVKPLQLSNVKEVVNKVLDRIDKESNREKIVLQLRQQLQESVSTMKEKFLRGLLDGMTINDGTMAEKLLYFQIPLGIDECVTIAIAKMDNYAAEIRGKSEEDKQLVTFSVLNIINDIISNYSAGFCICLASNEFVLFFNEKSQDEGKCNRICEEIIDLTANFLKLSVSIGIGNKVENINAVYHSYQNAAVAVQHRFYTGKQSIICIDDIANNEVMTQNMESGIHSNVFEAETKMVLAIRLGNKEKALSVFQSIVEPFHTDKTSTIEYIRGVCMELISITYRQLYETGENMNVILPDKIQVINDLLTAENIFRMKEQMSAIITTTAEFFSQKYNQKSLAILNRIKEVINNRYTEKIALSDIASEVFVSLNYMCLIFKKETGLTVNDYLTQVRMEAAKKMLKTTKMKIWEIAEEVGYENHHYFSTAFKKYTGMQPQYFREQL